MPLSYSQLSTYRRCPKQYEYASVKKVPRAISQGESFGSSLHNALRKFGLLELEHIPVELTKKQLPLFTEEHPQDQKPELSLHTLLSFWRSSFIAEGYENRAVMDAALLSGEAALKHFHSWWQEKKREVVAIEKGFSFPVPGTKNLVMSGRFDRIERTPAGLHIIDFKSSGPRPEDSLRTDLQLSLYALAAQDFWKEPVALLTILSITKDGVTPQNTDRSMSELQDAMTSIRLLAERMDSKEYPATPSVQACRYCPYREICPSKAIPSPPFLLYPSINSG